MKLMKRSVGLLVVLGIILGGFVACSNEKPDTPRENIPKNLLSIEEVKGIELEQKIPCSLAMYATKEEARENLTPIFLIEGTERKSILFSFKTNEEARIKCMEPVEEKKTMERKYAGAYLIEQEDDSQNFWLNFPNELDEEGDVIVYQIEIYFNKYRYIAFKAMQEV